MFSRFFLPSKTLMLFLEVYLCWKPVSLGQSRLYQRAHLGMHYMVAHHIVVQHKLNHRRSGELPSGAHSFNSRPSWSCEQELVSRNQLFKRRITLSTCKRTYSTAAELYVLLPPGKSPVGYSRPFASKAGDFEAFWVCPLLFNNRRSRVISNTKRIRNPFWRNLPTVSKQMPSKVLFVGKKTKKNVKRKNVKRDAWRSFGRLSFSE